jgi:hypothetical protein
MLSAETPDLIQLDVGVLRLRYGRASDPPVCARKPRGQIGACSRPTMLGATGVRNNFAMRRLPQPHTARLFAEDDGVIPPPDHNLGAVRRGRDSYEVTRGDSLGPR